MHHTPKEEHPADPDAHPDRAVPQRRPRPFPLHLRCAASLALAWRLAMSSPSSMSAALCRHAMPRQSHYELHLRDTHPHLHPVAIVLLSVVFLATALFSSSPSPGHPQPSPVFRLPARIPVCRQPQAPSPRRQARRDHLAQRAEDALSATAAYLFASFPNWMATSSISHRPRPLYLLHARGRVRLPWLLSLFPHGGPPPPRRHPATPPSCVWANGSSARPR